MSKTEWLRAPNFDARHHCRTGQPLYIQVYKYSGVHYKARHEFSPEFFLGKGKAILRKNQVTVRSVAEERLKALERTLCKARSIARHTGGRRINREVAFLACENKIFCAACWDLAKEVMTQRLE